MTRLVAPVVAAVFAAAACGGSGGASVTTTPSSASSAADVHVDERSNGRTVDVARGGHVVVVLHSTYWTLQAVGGVLRAQGAPVVSPSHCTVAGSGCGTVTATYIAQSAGSATLRAHRDSCGEALRCTGAAGDWTVTVDVH